MPLLALLAMAILSGCGSAPGNRNAEGRKLSAKPIGKAITIHAPLGLPPVPIPEDNPPTAETIALGEKLFFSPLLSVDKSVACANCHDPRKGFADGQQFSTGVGGKKGNRSAPPVQNSAYHATQFWDGRAPSLEAQAAGPMMNPIEMAHSLEGVERQCAQDPELRGMFIAAYGPADDPQQSPVTMDRITNAIASYERTLLRGNSPFDRYLYGGDKKALSAAAQRGLQLFRDPSKGNCAACHLVEERYALLADSKFHNLGVGMNSEGELTDLGRYLITKREGDQGAFRTPSLRNIAETAPYMHDGSLKTLKEVVDFYVGGGNSNPWLDPQIKPLTHLTGQERADLVTFLESLTGVPPSP